MAAELGERFIPLPADLGQAEARHGLIERVAVALGGLDAMVHCAARADWMPFEVLQRETFFDLMTLNTWAPLELVQQATPHLRQSDDPVVVFVGSVDAERPSAGAVAYGATKAALGAATVALAKELAPIRVVQVNPGLVDTPMVDGVTADLGDAVDSINLTGRPGHPEEVAGLIHYLISPLGRFANGTVYRLDGGALALGPFDTAWRPRTGRSGRE